MITAITRFVLTATGLLGGMVVTQVVDWQAELGLSPSYVIFVFVILGGSIGFVLGGIVGRELTTAWNRVEARISELSGADVILATVGLVIGLLVAFLAMQPLRLLDPPWLAISASVLVSVTAAYLGVGIAMTRRRELVSMFPALASAVDLPGSQRDVVLDTSAIIDGRFVELSRLGFLSGRVRVPRFVLGELQTLADSSDDTRRARGRRGLDLLSTLPEGRAVDVFEIDYPDLAAVDDKLMRLGADAGAAIVTVDYNLSKVARVRGLEVLNLNEAAGALRPTFLPGDVIPLRIAKSGKEAGQGVGYLEDGTMVVVVDGKDLIGRESLVEVTSVLQTSAGRMIFAKPGDVVSEEDDR